MGGGERWVRGPSAVARTGLWPRAAARTDLERCTFMKFPLGKNPVGKYPVGKYQVTSSQKIALMRL